MTTQDNNTEDRKNNYITTPSTTYTTTSSSTLIGDWVYYPNVITDTKSDTVGTDISFLQSEKTEKFLIPGGFAICNTYSNPELQDINVYGHCIGNAYCTVVGINAGGDIVFQICRTLQIEERDNSYELCLETMRLQAACFIASSKAPTRIESQPPKDITTSYIDTITRTTISNDQWNKWYIT
jgi:hypothetical protein